MSLKGGVTGEKTIREGGHRRGEGSNPWNISCLGPRAPAALRHDVSTYTASTATFSDGLRSRFAIQSNGGGGGTQSHVGGPSSHSTASKGERERKGVRERDVET